MSNPVTISAFEDELEKISYNLGYSALAGGLAGGATGWVGSHDDNEVKRTLLGAGVGALTGVGAHLGARKFNSILNNKKDRALDKITAKWAKIGDIEDQIYEKKKILRNRIHAHNINLIISDRVPTKAPRNINLSKLKSTRKKDPMYNIHGKIKSLKDELEKISYHVGLSAAGGGLLGAGAGWMSSDDGNELKRTLIGAGVGALGGAGAHLGLRRYRANWAKSRKKNAENLSKEIAKRAEERKEELIKRRKVSTPPITPTTPGGKKTFKSTKEHIEDTRRLLDSDTEQFSF